jgi:Domain of unknown function (DUF4192)
MEPTTFTARTPEDLIALAPLVLGFQPEESLVMLTFGDSAFHARIDLPGSDDDVEEVVALLVEPVLAHGMSRVVFLVFSQHRPRPGLVGALIETFTRSDVDVIDVIQADGRRWFPLLPDGGRGAGVAYDVAGHPFVAASVVTGQVTWSSRGALADSVSADPRAIETVAPLLEALPADVPRRQRLAERSWLLAAMAAADEGRSPDPGQVARLVRDLGDRRLWQAALLHQSRERADGQAMLWTTVVRAAPEGWVAGPAALLGFVAWLGGQGALAWCAVDRCRAEAADDERAGVLTELLLDAVAPSRWAEVVGHGRRDPA